jgi:uncharacterized protein (TIGR02145 family)
MKTTVKLIIISLTIVISACKDDIKLPTVITTPITDTTSEYVITGGEVINNGGSPVTARGICYSTVEINPELTDDLLTWYTLDGSGIGNFTSTFNFVYAGAGYTIAQKHYLRAYATNSEGTAYGETLSISPKSMPPEFNSINLINLTSTKAVIECEFGIAGGRSFTIDEFYFCYGTSPNPTIEGIHVIPQQVPDWGAYYVLMDLEPSSNYYVRGYIKNESGFVYSPEISFTTFDSEIIDIDGNIYPTKSIGNQVWMASNLIVSKYNDGTTIPTIYNDWDWSVTENGSHNADRYNYYTIVDSRKLCPSGWHVPSDSEWKTLEIYLGMSLSDADILGENRGSDEGGKLKMQSNNAYNKKVWEYPNLGATNSSGFSSEGVAWRFASGSYSTFYYSTSFWTMSELDETSVLIRRLYYNSAKVARYTDEKNAGLCVRCIKD